MNWKLVYLTGFEFKRKLYQRYKRNTNLIQNMGIPYVLNISLNRLDATTGKQDFPCCAVAHIGAANSAQQQCCRSRGGMALQSLADQLTEGAYYAYHISPPAP